MKTIAQDGQLKLVKNNWGEYSVMIEDNILITTSDLQEAKKVFISNKDYSK